jgi:hypothetical protein
MLLVGTNPYHWLQCEYCRDIRLLHDGENIPNKESKCIEPLKKTTIIVDFVTDMSGQEYPFHYVLQCPNCGKVINFIGMRSHSLNEDFDINTLLHDGKIRTFWDFSVHDACFLVYAIGNGNPENKDGFPWLYMAEGGTLIWSATVHPLEFRK